MTTPTDSPGALERVLQRLLVPVGEEAADFSSIDDWWPAFRSARREWTAPIDQALIGGCIADRVGYAFAAGYQGALRRMDPGLPLDRMASFSVTEEGGGHPRAVLSTLLPNAGGFLLNGKKKWATMSSAGGVALVVASTGVDEQGRNRLRVARVDLGQPGVSVIRMPETPFSPEVPHCRLEFVDVEITADQVLADDGYERFVKPFRTHEDIHVSAAILAYLLRIAGSYEWPTAAREELLSMIVALRGLAHADPSAPAVHLAIEGVFKARHQLLERCAAHWEKVDAKVRGRWERDAALSGIAGGVRAKRAEAAWARLIG